MRPENSLFHTRTRPNLIRTSFFPPAGRHEIKSGMGTRYRSASDDHVTISHTGLLFMDLEGFQVGVRFGIYILAEPIIIGTSYIDCFTNFIFPRERMIVLVHSGMVLIVFAYAPTFQWMTIVYIAENVRQLFSFLATFSRMGKQIIIQWNTEMMMSMLKSQAGLSSFSQHPNALKSHCTLAASETVDTVLYEPLA